MTSLTFLLLSFCGHVTLARRRPLPAAVGISPQGVTKLGTLLSSSAFLLSFSSLFFFLLFSPPERSKHPSFNAAQLSRLHDVKCFSLTHFNLVNMLQQVANFSGMALPRHLHIKRFEALSVSGRGVASSRGLLLQVGLLDLALRRRRVWLEWLREQQLSPSPPPEAGQRISRGEGASPTGCHEGSQGRGHIYPQVRLLNRIWRWMDVDSREEITGLS